MSNCRIARRNAQFTGDGWIRSLLNRLLEQPLCGFVIPKHFPHVGQLSQELAIGRVDLQQLLDRCRGTGEIALLRGHVGKRMQISLTGATIAWSRASSAAASPSATMD